MSKQKLPYVCFLHNHGNIATEGSPKSGLCPTLMELFKGLFTVHSTIVRIAYSRLGFEPFGALYMYHIDDKHPTRPGLEPVLCVSSHNHVNRTE